MAICMMQRPGDVGRRAVGLGGHAQCQDTWLHKATSEVEKVLVQRAQLKENRGELAKSERMRKSGAEKVEYCGLRGR